MNEGHVSTINAFTTLYSCKEKISFKSYYFMFILQTWIQSYIKFFYALFCHCQEQKKLNHKNAELTGRSNRKVHYHMAKSNYKTHKKRMDNNYHISDLVQTFINVENGGCWWSVCHIKIRKCSIIVKWSGCEQLHATILNLRAATIVHVQGVLSSKCRQL